MNPRVGGPWNAVLCHEILCYQRFLCLVLLNSKKWRTWSSILLLATWKGLWTLIWDHLCSLNSTVLLVCMVTQNPVADLNSLKLPMTERWKREGGRINEIASVLALLLGMAPADLFILVRVGWRRRVPTRLLPPIQTTNAKIMIYGNEL